MSLELVTDREIRDVVLNLIEEANEEITIVSPYNQNVDGLAEALNNRRQGVKVVWYYSGTSRNGMSPNLEKELPRLNKIRVDSLHAKIYANEKTVLVTSLNLNYGSWNINKEIGLLIHNDPVANEIRDYVRRLNQRASGARKREVKVRRRSDIPISAELAGTHNGRRYTCVVDRQGSQPKVTYNGEEGLSLTAAAEEITREPTNGPDFWWYGGIQVSKLRYA